MSYTNLNYKSKKALKEAVNNGEQVTCFNPGMGGPLPENGTVYLEGPHFPAPHSWYAKATVKNGVVVKVA